MGAGSKKLAAVEKKKDFFAECRQERRERQEKAAAEVAEWKATENAYKALDDELRQCKVIRCPTPIKPLRGEDDTAWLKWHKAVDRWDLLLSWAHVTPTLEYMIDVGGLYVTYKVRKAM